MTRLDLATRPRAASRRDVLGASEVAEVLGLGGFADTSPMRVWLHKRTPPDAEPEEQTDAQLRGHVLERAVCDWYSMTTGEPCEPVTDLQHPLVGPEPWMGATPDRVVRGDAGDWLLEAKTSRDAQAWGEEGTDAIPPYYLVQVVWQMAVVGCDRVDVAVYLPWHDGFRAYTVRRDDAVERRIVDEARAWWERHIIGAAPPPLDASSATLAYLQERHPRSSKVVRHATAEEAALAEELRATRAVKAGLLEHEATIGAQLRDAIGADDGIDGPWGRILWSERKGAERIDAKRLRAEYPDAARACTITGAAGRTFRPTFPDDAAE